jgi:RNA recognition motif-containing protein
MKVKSIIDYFAEYGPLTYLKMDKRRSDLGSFSYSYLHRGCGFVEFADSYTKHVVLTQLSHVLEGKHFEVKMALTSS